MDKVLILHHIQSLERTAEIILFYNCSVLHFATQKTNGAV